MSKRSCLTIGFILIYLLPGCAKEITRIDARTLERQIKFPTDNVTTKKEVIDRLGISQKSFEQEHILVYRVCEDGDNISLPNPKIKLQECVLDLILIFTNDGVLEQHSLVKGVRNP